MNLHKRIFLRKRQLLKLVNRLPGKIYQYRQWKDGRCAFPYSTLDVEDIFFATPVELAKDGRIAWDRVDPEHIGLVQEALRKSAENLEEFEITFRVRSPQNRIHWIRNHAVPERLRDGSTLWHGHLENITAQYEAETIAKQKSALLNVIFDNLPDQIYYMDRDSRLLGINPACCHHHGKTAEEMVGKTDMDLYPDETGKVLYDEEQKLMANGQIFKEQEKHVRSDGSVIYLESVKCPLRSPSGQVIGLAGISRDVTAQVQNEEALTKAKLEAEHNAAFLQAIFDNMEDSFYCYDRDARVITGNRSWLKYSGADSVEELIGKTDIDIFPAPLGKELYEKGRKLLAEGGISRDRIQHVTKNGDVVYRESLKCLMRNKAGEVLGLVGISRDITQQVQNELALANAKQEAEQNNAFLHAIFDNLEDEFYYKDRQSKVLGGNRAWVKSRGVTSINDLIGKTDIDLHPAPMGQLLYDNEQRQMAAGEVTRIREQHTRKDGTVEYVEAIKCPMRNEKGEVIGVAGVSRDITRQVENEKILIEAQQAAETANKAKSAFLAMMSHEIRTPMNGVIGAASLLLGTELTPQQQEFIHTIQVSGENLLTIINDILDYSKIEAGKIELEAEPFNVRNCIEDAFDLFVQAAAKKNIELLYHIDPDIPTMLTGDTTRLRQILVNLLGNAIKFTENGDVRLKVHKLPEDNGLCRLEFAVSDSGIGIADEHKDRLFQAFTQADVSNTRKYGGTGLGLTISRRLTELMGGKIWFESKRGEGSTFFFTVALPVADSAAAGKAEHLSIEALRGKRALIVDDNETNRWILSDQLAQWGMLSEAFAHPQKALEHLQGGETYDIALIDFQMPDMDGGELAKKMYLHGNKPHMPVIILSSSYEHIPADPSIYARLSKPVRINKLCEQMRQALADKKIKVTENEVPATHLQPKKKRNLRILVAEDNPINQRIAQLMLVQLGCETIVVVPDGEAAVAAVMDATYDLILMDIQMPHMDGLEATRRIREYTGQSEKPWIIALTAGVMKEEQDAAKKVGMNEFIAKPLNTEQLGKALDGFASLSAKS